MQDDDDLAAIVDIVTASRQALSFVAGMDLERFLTDVKTSSAVILQLLILGEASKRLSAEFRSYHSEMPWSEISRMRDRLIHHYRRTDPKEVWRTVEKDLPEVLRILEPLIAGLSRDPRA